MHKYIISGSILHLYLTCTWPYDAHIGWAQSHLMVHQDMIHLDYVLLSIRVDIIVILISLIMLWNLLFNMGWGSISCTCHYLNPLVLLPLPLPLLAMPSTLACCVFSRLMNNHGRSVTSNSIHVLVHIWNNQNHINKNTHTQKQFQHILKIFRLYNTNRKQFFVRII